MLLVVDAGSTKADWFLAGKGKVIGKYKTVGFNPYFHTSDFVYEALSSSDLKPVADAVSHIEYFGAGCSSPVKNRIIEDGLKRFFVNAAVSVQHDLLASAYATCGDEEGIACILGTGSNSCYFDGVKVHEHNYGLGYILGDEGSGSYYGKKLVTNYLYGLMPENLHNSFKSEYNLDKDTIITRVYSKTDANVWLASLSQFIGKYRTDMFIQELLLKGMREFIELYICHYKNYDSIPVHFVGSIAFHYQEELKKAAEDYPIRIGRIIKRPIEELMNYFLQKQTL